MKRIAISSPSIRFRRIVFMFFSVFRKNSVRTFIIFSPFLFLNEVNAEAYDVGITPDMTHVDVVHQGKPLKIQRIQDQGNEISPNFAKTSRACPPFCIQPMQLAPGVETIGELEMLAYLKRVSADEKGLLIIDSRTPEWVEQGTIPGSINLPWTLLHPASGADPLTISEILSEKFGVSEDEGLWDFRNAKTLVMFCNGMWCGQSPTNILTLLRLGYPAHKIKWFRGGMQTWETLGLTTVKPGRAPED